MADLWWLMLALGVAVCAVFAVLLVVGLRRRGRLEDPEATPGHRSFVVWGAALPSVIILVVFVASTAAMRYVPNTAPDDALVVELVAHQFWWEVRYPEAGVTATDELHLPVGRPVALQLTSADVIHSFWVPELGGKLDALPDHPNTLVLRGDVPGRYVSRCAEFCGLEHATMAIDVVVEPEADFTAYLESLE